MYNMYYFEEMLDCIIKVTVPLVFMIVSAVVATFIQTKTNLKYKDEIANAAANSVMCVNQTYVDDKKKDGTFNTDEAHNKALNMAIEKTTELLSEGAKAFLRRTKAPDDYIKTLVEKEVKEQKLIYSKEA